MKSVFGLVWIGIILAAIIGWCMNIAAVVHTVDAPVTGMFILRCFGILMAPLGAVLGLFF